VANTLPRSVPYNIALPIPCLVVYLGSVAKVTKMGLRWLSAIVIVGLLADW